MASPILKITNGADYVDLLTRNGGLILNDWQPALPGAKGGGVYRESVMSDGRNLLMRRFENPIETFSLRVQGESQDSIILVTQNLIRLLQQATNYWENRWTDVPVWIEARGSLETETRYALVHNYTIDSLDNPYAQPFFNCDPGIQSMNVAIERGHWTSTPPLEPICLPVYSDNGSSILEDTENVPNGNSDAYVKDALGAGDYTFWRTDTQLILGTESDTDEFEFAIRVDDVDIPQGAHVQYAAIGLRLASAHSASIDQWIKIEIENGTDPAVYSDLTNYQSRPYAPLSYLYEMDGGSQSAGYLYEIDGLQHVVQQIVDLGTWEAGNAMAFKFSINEGIHHAGTVWNFASYENASYAEPYLEVRYAVESTDKDQCQTTGRLAWDTVTKHVEAETFIGARHTEVGLTHIFHYDATGPTWSSNLLTTALPYELFPATPAAGDMVYFGSDQANLGGGTFYGLVFDFTAGFAAGVVGVWEWSLGGSSWNAFSSPPTSQYIEDNTNSFMGIVTGSIGEHPEYGRLMGRDVHWLGLEDHSGSNSWREDTVNSVNAWWIRFRITTASSGNVTVQRHPSAIVSPKISIDAGDVGGDFPALGRMRFFGTANDHNIRKILVGMRTRYPDRGSKPGFSAYIPIQDIFTPSGVDQIYTAHSYEDHAEASNGRIPRYNPSGAGTGSLATVYLDTQAYMGRYRLFARVGVEGGTNSDVEVYARITNGSIYYDTRSAGWLYKASGWDSEFKLLDFGLVDIPQSGAILDELSTTRIELRATVDSGTPEVLPESIILIPADEWIGEIAVLDESGPAPLNDRWAFTSFDSLTDFREELLAVHGQNVSTTERLESSLDKVSAPGSFVIPANTNVDFWFLPFGHQDQPSAAPYTTTAEVYANLSARIQVLERYQGMRGSR